MKTSRRGVELIASFEGFVGHPYRDAVGVWTIGFGHTGPDVHSMGNLTRDQGLALLARDLPRYEAPVNAIGARFTQGQFDALVSLAYNCGPGAVQGTIARLAKAGNMDAIPGVMRQYVHAGGRVLAGLVRRRNAEVDLFRSTGTAAPASDALGHLTATERRWCREYDHLKARGENVKRRRSLQAAMRAQRKRIWRAAQKSGWNRANRRDRYHSLLARTS